MKGGAIFQTALCTAVQLNLHILFGDNVLRVDNHYLQTN